MPAAQLWEKADMAFHWTPTWRTGTVLKGGKHNDPEGKKDPGHPGQRYP